MTIKYGTATSDLTIEASTEEDGAIQMTDGNFLYPRVAWGPTTQSAPVLFVETSEGEALIKAIWNNGEEWEADRFTKVFNRNMWYHTDTTPSQTGNIEWPVRFETAGGQGLHPDGFSYATLSDLQARFLQREFDETTKPTAGQASRMLVDVAAEINMIAGEKVQVPISHTLSPLAYDFVRNMNANGAAALVQEAVYGERSDTEDKNPFRVLYDRNTEMLKAKGQFLDSIINKIGKLEFRGRFY